MQGHLESHQFPFRNEMYIEIKWSLFAPGKDLKKLTKFNYNLLKLDELAHLRLQTEAYNI